MSTAKSMPRGAGNIAIINVRWLCLVSLAVLLTNSGGFAHAADGAGVIEFEPNTAALIAAAGLSGYEGEEARHVYSGRQASSRDTESWLAQSQREGGSSEGRSGSSSSRSTTENPPGFYVPVEPTYPGRKMTVRATIFSSNYDLLSLSFAWSRHPVFDIEVGFYANPLWCSGFVDRCRDGVSSVTGWGSWLQFGISRQLADQRGIRRRAWSFEVPFHLELRYVNGDNISTLLAGVHVGIEFVRWFRPDMGLALKLTAGSPFLNIPTGDLQSLDIILRGSIGLTF